MARRNRKFIDTRVQGALVQRMLVHWLVFLSACCIVAVSLQFLANPVASVAERTDQFRWMMGPFVLAALFMLPIFVWDSIKFSHRIVGPIIRLQNEMRRIGTSEEEVDAVVLRKNDFWKDVATDFNAMLERLGVKTRPRDATVSAEETNTETLAT